jgi:hypothetical protein
MRKQVEVLEHESDTCALAENDPFREFLEPVSLKAHADWFAVDADVSEVQALQMIDRPQQR